MSHPARPTSPPAPPLRERPVVQALHGVPLRLRLVAVTVGLLLIALVTAGLASSLVLQNYVLGQKRDELHRFGPYLTQQVAREYWQEGTMRETSSYNGDAFVATVARAGEQVHTETDSFPQVPAIEPAAEAVLQHTARIIAANDRQTRWLAASYRDPYSTNHVITVAIPLATADRTITQTRWWTIAISLSAAGLTVVLGWFLIRRAFRPLTQIEDTAKAIAAGDLTRRVPTPPSGDEVASVATSLNVMLGRIEHSFAAQTASEERMRQFVADASHELRTPLATMRGYAELYRQGAVSTPEDVAGSMRRIEGEAVRMSALVDDLLLLTRLDHAGQNGTDRPVVREPVDLTVLAADATQDAQARDPERTIRLVGLTGSLEPAVVCGDEAQLRQVFTNLLANAMRHTPAGTPIEIVLGRAEATIRLEVRDHGPGIAPALRERVFERFFRADPSRNTASGGTGLGLSIVGAIISGHGGQVSIEQTPGGGATVVVQFTQITPSQNEVHPQPRPVT